MSDPPAIDPRAVVDPGATIGRGATVGPFSVIGPDVTIGEGSSLASHVVVRGITVIGRENRIDSMASIGGDPQDLKYDGEPTRLEIGDRNRIREFVTLNRGTSGGGGTTRIGDDNLLMAYVHIAHDCRVGSRTIFGNSATLAGHVDVGDDATVGAFSAVHQFCRVAKHAFIGGASILTRDALPWVTTVGNRAKAFGLNAVGLRRQNYPRETISALKTCYSTLFQQGLKLEEALDRVEDELGHVEEIRYFVEFVRSSKRGVSR